ncbi:YybH family protein [Dyadobacter subterraneus]|uniref:Nuclear transport factor 2 family protein n=1 Tax=Dyadobacter subterraneus TaxID=2773304 RepID=A0ABR9WD56_9BACT|nr:nuclear transport factor 2 family protein [Dyadobacter subterraneus]MBE9463338.1 nuclear transport factor 2 family protein [Dyadobacter subterraneus]
MKTLMYCLVFILLEINCSAGDRNDLEKDKKDFIKTTEMIRSAFARGDVAMITSLHHPNVIKAFGGNNYVDGRDAMVKGLIQTFNSVKLEFTENKIENTLFNGDTAVETSIFTMKATPKNGRPISYSRGRAMVIYIRYKDSPTGWASIREMAQAAPDEK